MDAFHTPGKHKNSFPKSEKLTGKKEIQELFDKGSSFYLHPFLIKYTFSDEQTTFPKVLVTVPKKKFKRAVDRNRLKRQIKEAYRLNKKLLIGEKKPQHLGIIYTASEKIPYNVLEKKLNLALHRLQKEQNS